MSSYSQNITLFKQSSDLMYLLSRNIHLFIGDLFIGGFSNKITEKFIYFVVGRDVKYIHRMFCIFYRYVKLVNTSLNPTIHGIKMNRNRKDWA